MTTIEAHFSGYLDDFHLDVSFTAPAQGVTALFGPSGCGKTSVLRCIAGLNKMRTGYLKVANSVWQNSTGFIPTHKRPIGYIFQEATLFPHLNVEQNLAFGLRRSKTPAKIPIYDNVINLLNLDKLMKRNPVNLSGGERQRAAIGRALLSGPEVLLMDEPLSALDLDSKNEIIPYLETLREEFSIPIVYVSHDIHEIERIADHIVLMENGGVMASGPVSELLVDDQLPLAHRPDSAVIFEARINGYDEEDQLTSLVFSGGEIFLPGQVGAINSVRRLRVFANDVSLSPTPPSQTTILNVLEATITKIHSVANGQVNVICRLGEGDVKVPARITRRSFKTFQFKEGQLIYLQLKSVSLVGQVS